MNTHAQPVAVSSVRKASNALSSSTKARSPKVSKLSEDNTSQAHQTVVTQQPIQLATPS